MFPQASTPAVPRPPQPTQAESSTPQGVGHRLAHLTPSQEEDAQRNSQAPDWPSDRTAAAGEPDHGSVNTLLRTSPGNHGQSATETSLSSTTHDIGRFILTICHGPYSLNGHFCDVYEGVHSEVGRVALKRPRGCHDEESIRRFKREGLTWSSLQHSHILRFLGTFERHGFIYLVSPLINNGTLVEYIRHHPKANRIRLLCETADAINYLHQNNIVHGDIKGSNILIDDDIHCLVCDFGLTKSASSNTSAGLKGAGTLRWQSPELWFDEPKSFSSDVYAFSMTIVEVLTGKAPFTRMKLDSEVMRVLMFCDERPSKFPDSLFGVSYTGTWEVAEACWSKNPTDRISMSVAFQRLTVESTLPVSTEEGGGEINWHERDRSRGDTRNADEMYSSSPTDDIGTLIEIISKDAIGSGCFFDIFEGRHSTAGRVALKRPRLEGSGGIEPAIRRIQTEAIAWRRLRHPSILTFLGTFQRDGHIYLVSSFINNGNVLEYIGVHPGVNRIRLLCEIAGATNYLHENNIIHGDIKGSNVLIDNDAHCLLCDFGLSKMEPSITSTAVRGTGRRRWESPELWFGKPKSFSSDTYAFGMTIAEVVSGAPPFTHLNTETAIMLAVINADERPPKLPESLFGLSYKSTWEVAEACWSKDPETRISMSLAFLHLQRASSLIDDIGSLITWISPMPVKVNGNSSDIFSGTHQTIGKVALKRPRIGTVNEAAIRRFQREATIWRSLQHPHILESLGTFERDGYIYFVSPFTENGSVIAYIGLHPRVNRISLLSETADAIAYLHQQGVVHGDIKGSNLLIGDNGQVLVSDFGLARTTDFRTSTGMRGAGTLRWQSPELWNGSSKSFKSDVYAFGMTIAEVLTGNVPFREIQTDGAVIRAVLIEGRRPKKPAASPAGLSYEKVWAVAEACWSAFPEERISMSKALKMIQEDPALTVTQADPAVTQADPALPATQEIPSSSLVVDVGAFIISISFSAVSINGHFCDVYEGMHSTAGRVALKRPRIAGTGEEAEIMRRFEREAITWQRLRHPHILEFLGTFRHNHDLYLVSPLINNGTLVEYTARHPRTNRIRLLCETADALNYLHQNDIVHGDIKGTNILIDDNIHCLLCDFGLSKVTQSRTSIALRGGGSSRWQSPELLLNAPESFSSDAYAFAMTIVEVLSGKAPFAYLKNDAAVLFAVLGRDERPPKDPTESLFGVSYLGAWDVAEACWSKNAEERISMSIALQRLQADPHHRDRL